MNVKTPFVSNWKPRRAFLFRDWHITLPALERELLAPLFHVAKKKSGQNIMLGGLKTLKNLGESISDTQITVSWSVWKRTQKNRYFGPKMAVFDIFSV